jgi:hypothetical protein
VLAIGGLVVYKIVRKKKAAPPASAPVATPVPA